MDIPDFASLYDWLRSAEFFANGRRRRTPARIGSLSEILDEPHRFLVVVMPHPEDLIEEPPFIVDLATEEAIAFRKTRGMGAGRLQKLSLRGVKWLEARTKRSLRLIQRLASGRRLTGERIE